MRTITQSSIKTNGTDGVIQVMPVSENRIKEGREVIAEIKRQLGLYEVMVLRQLIAKRGMLPKR